MRFLITRKNPSSTAGKRMWVEISKYVMRSGSCLDQATQIAFVFAAEGEAHAFYKKVANRHKYASAYSTHTVIMTSDLEIGVSAKVKEDKKEKSTPTKSKSKKGGKIDKSLISGPVRPSIFRHPTVSHLLTVRIQSAGSFKHVAHMGYDSEKGFSSTGVDSSWQVLLEQLSTKGISPKQIQKNEQFIKDFVHQQGGIDKVSGPSATL